MKDMGFNTQASIGTQEAFIKYLIRQSTGTIVQTPTEKKLLEESAENVLRFPEQLRFDFDETENKTPHQKTGKA